jgi:hypothetical protein
MCALLAARAGVARDAEKDATGRWTWSQALRTGEAVVWTLDLKQDGEKLTGILSFSGGNVVPIKEGKVRKDDVSFEIESSRPIGVLRSIYTGKLQGDTIEFKVQSERNGKRVQAAPSFKAKRAVSGVNVGK